MITDQGLNHLLNVALAGITQVGTWYLGIIDSTGFAGLAAGDTAASHAGWAESVAYTEATRPAWDEAAATAQVVSTTAAVAFTMTADATIKGFFLASSSTKGGTAGTLLATALFQEGDRDVVAGQQLQLTIQFTGADASAS